jgi:hypothetical protein
VTPELLEKALGKEGSQNLNNSSILMTSLVTLIAENRDSDKFYSVSLRRAFVPASGCLIIAADYSQVMKGHRWGTRDPNAPP